MGLDSTGACFGWTTGGPTKWEPYSMSQSRVKYHDVSTVPYGEIFLWACSATGLLAPTSREAPKQEGKGAFRGLRARRRLTSFWLCQHVLELWSFNFRARLRCLFGCTWKDIDNAFVQYYYLRGVLTCPKYLWNTVKHCTFSLVFFNFFFWDLIHLSTLHMTSRFRSHLLSWIFAVFLPVLGE